MSDPEEWSHRTAELPAYDRFLQLYDSMLGATSLTDVLAQVGDVVRDALDAEGATVYLVRPESQELEARTMVDNVIRTIRLPIRPESLAGYCAVTGEAFRIADAYGDLSDVSPGLTFDRSWDEAYGYRTRDVLCAPACFADEVIGVVQVLNSRSGGFTDLDLRVLEQIARLVGYALHHARVYDDLASMRQLEKEKARFMQIMVHELKSPVAAARTMTSLLSNDLVPAAKIPEIIGRIEVRLDAMLEMIRETLELSRMAAGDPLGDIGVLDLTTEVGRLVEDYEPRAAEKGLAFTRELSAEPIPVRFDRRGLQLVVSNLLSNAVKYTAEGSVGITVTHNGEQASIAVSDTGIGIPADDVPKLFREFFRASNARQAKIEGSGVGLAGVRLMVERFGGALSLDTRENVGTTFTVRLPLSPIDDA